MSDKTPKLLIGALRQFRHNNDNSPDLYNPAGGFVTALDYVETVRVVTDLEQQLAELKAAALMADADEPDGDLAGRAALAQVLIKWGWRND